jgi:hypothetical protein
MVSRLRGSESHRKGFPALPGCTLAVGPPGPCRLEEYAVFSRSHADTLAWVFLELCGPTLKSGPDTKHELQPVKPVSSRVAKGERDTAGPSASSGFPVRLNGFSEPHAAFLRESRIRGRFQSCVVGNPEFARDDKI